MSGSDPSNVKAGDALLVVDRHSPDRIVTVDRVTAKQIITGATRYRKDSGRRVGADTWDSTCVCPATKEDITRIRDETRRRRAFNAIWALFNDGRGRDRLKALPVERLEQALALLTSEES